MKMDALAYAPIHQLSLINLQLKSCRVPAAHSYTMPAPPVERFVYITRGSVCFFLNNCRLEAKAWDMVYLPGGTAYRSKWLEASEFIVVDILLRSGDGQDIRFGDSPCVLFHDSHHVYEGLLGELGQKAEATGPFDWLERLSLTFKLLCEMARDTNGQELDEKYRRIQPALTCLDNNYTEDHSVEMLAKMCALSPASFRRLFLECKGVSPVENRNRLRIRKAAELLKTGSFTVGEAAEQVGIGDIKYFGKLFKRYAGITPGALKKSGI